MDMRTIMSTTDLGGSPAAHRRRAAILLFVTRYIGEHGYGPTLREVGKGVVLGSTSTIARDLDALASRGHLARRSEVARGIALAAATAVNTSFLCQASTRWDGTDVADHLHQACPGHVYQAWDQREFQCECDCGHVGAKVVTTKMLTTDDFGGGTVGQAD